MAGVEGQAVRGVCPPRRSRRPGRSIPTARAHLKQGVYDPGGEEHRPHDDEPTIPRTPRQMCVVRV